MTGRSNTDVDVKDVVRSNTMICRKKKNKSVTRNITLAFLYSGVQTLHITG